MIVYGWKSYYKRNSSYRRDVCQACGRPGHLHSYSTTRCFHIYFIPIIPYAQIRITDQCPSCEAGRELSLREWKKLREKELRPAIEAVRKEPANRENAEKALGFVTEVGSKREFAELVGLLAGHFNNDAQILARLGWCFHYFGMPNEGAHALKQSLQLEENEEVRNLLKFHENDAQTMPPNPPAKIGQLAPVLIAPAIILVALGAVLLTSVTGKPERVFLVNGLEIPCDALVNGVRTQVNPLSHVRLPVEYGEIRVDPVEGGPAFEPVVETVETSFLSRAGKGPVVVFNPDRTAVLQWRKAVYFAESAMTDEEAFLKEEYDFHVGKGSYVFDKVDAAFVDLPANVSLSSSTDIKFRIAVEQITDWEPADVISMLLGKERFEAAIAYGQQRLTFFPEDDNVLMYLSSISDSEELIGFLEGKLDERPVLVEWHRYYQQAVGNTDPERDLLAHYRALLEKEPGNRDLTYLVGRLIDDPDESLAMLEKATQPPNPSAHGFNAIAYHHMKRGDFEKALEFEQKARKFAPEKLQFKTLEEEMLLATERYDELIRRRREDLAENPGNQNVALALNSLFALTDRKDLAQQLAVDSMKVYEGTPDDTVEFRQRLKAIFDATYEQSRRNLPLFARHSETIGQGLWLYYPPLVNGDLERANEILVENESNTYLEQLLLFSLATEAKKTEFADERRKEAVAMLEQGLVEQQRVAQWFADGAAAPGLEEVYANTDWPESSRVILTALGVRFPRMKDVYFAAARKMNYDPVFPGLVLDGLLAAKPPATAAPPAPPAPVQQ